MPDFIFHNGSIVTMDPVRPQVEAVAVRAGRILALGDADEVLPLARSDTRKVDLDGSCLVPGIHDSHVHLGQHGLELGRLNLTDTPTLAEALAQVRERARELPAGSWILGSGFAMSRWDVTRLGKEQLDKVAPEHPVLLKSQDHHSAWTNSLALRLAGVHGGTPDPKSGVVVKGEDGEPSGLLLEHASQLVAGVVPQPSDEELAAAMWRGAQHLAHMGITTVHHMSYESPRSLRQMALLASREDFPVRVWACLPQEDAEHAAALGIATGQGGDRFAIGGAKFFVDGALGSLTAWMLEPYAGTADTGVVVDGPEVLAERLPVVLEAGLTPVVHAIGDAANRAVLDALEATQDAWRARGLRPRIEHVQHIHPRDVTRLARLGVVASMQADHLRFDAKRIRQLLGDRLERAYPIRSLLAAGAPLAFGSDTPVAQPDWRRGLLAAVRRLGTDGDALSLEECISPGEALAAYTRGAAYAISREARSGMLREGFDADFALLSHDPLESLDDLAVLGTMLAGRWTREAGVGG